jgi:hypothetical protein
VNEAPGPSIQRGTTIWKPDPNSSGFGMFPVFGCSLYIFFIDIKIYFPYVKILKTQIPSFKIYRQIFLVSKPRV